MLKVISSRRKIYVYSIFIFFFLTIIFLISNFIVGPMLVVGTSMEPNIKNGQWIIVRDTNYSLFENYRRNDIILYSKGGPHGLRLGRIIGIPGDRLLVKNNILYVNGSVYDLPGLNTENLECLQEEKSLYGGYWFIINDNPTSGINSCDFGYVRSKEIKGFVLSKLPF